jgi:hypothetical protein
MVPGLKYWVAPQEVANSLLALAKLGLNGEVELAEAIAKQAAETASLSALGLAEECAHAKAFAAKLTIDIVGISGGDVQRTVGEIGAWGESIEAMATNTARRQIE